MKDSFSFEDVWNVPVGHNPNTFPVESPFIVIEWPESYFCFLLKEEPKSLHWNLTMIPPQNVWIKYDLMCIAVILGSN